jgi:uncharacterized protein YchJ
MTEENIDKEEDELECKCGSGKKAGDCCQTAELCSCGSGKKAGDCCQQD